MSRSEDSYKGETPESLGAENSAQKSVGTSVATMPGNNGGTLRRGSKKGNTPGSGRPKDQVREKLAKLANGKGIAFLKSLMDGKVEVQLVGECPHCHETADMDAKWVEIVTEQVRASVDHRLKGNEQALRFGIGTKDEVDVVNDPKVQEFVALVARVTIEEVGEEAYQRIAARVQELAA